MSDAPKLAAGRVSNGTQRPLPPRCCREKFEVGNFHARAEMRLVTENGVADVIEMRRLRGIEQQRVFQFARIADHAAVADDDVFAEIGIVADLAVFADDGRAFDHRAVLNDGAFANKNIVANARPWESVLADSGFRFGQCSLQFS